MTTTNARLGFGFFAAAAAWPSVYGAISAALQSPLERAIFESYCGGAPHAAWLVLGHCGACWSGAAALFAAGAVTLLANRRAALPAAA